MTLMYAGHGSDVRLILLNTAIDSTPCSYSGDAGFEAKPRDRLLYLRGSRFDSVPPGARCFNP